MALDLQPLTVGASPGYHQPMMAAAAAFKGSLPTPGKIKDQEVPGEVEASGGPSPYLRDLDALHSPMYPWWGIDPCPPSEG